MKIEKDIFERLYAITDSISVIDESLQGLGFGEYYNDRKKMILVVRQFETIISSVKALPEEFKAKYPEIDWEEIENLGNSFIHYESGVDEEKVWGAAKHKLHRLYKFITKLLQ
ncbi:MAG: hypothetical protein QG635_1544 [Bacteroidota bacterium]|nr:hypothetical protein [Bacteroidota bacterium]